MRAAVFVAISGSYRIAAYARAARAAGFEAVVVTHANAAAVPPGTTGIAVEFDPYPDFARTVIQALSHMQVEVVLGVDDACVEIASRLAAEFGVEQNPVDAAKLSSNKYLSRKRLYNAGLPVPEHVLIPSAKLISSSDLDFGPPWVVKPIDLSASRGVIRADDWSQLQPAVDKCRTIAADAGASGDILIERYIDGDEIAVDAIIGAKGVQILAIFDKPEPLTGPYFEEGIYVTPSAMSSTVRERVEQVLCQVCEALGIVVGPVHAEFRICDGQPWILEIATRTIGGDCGNIFQMLLPISVEQLVLEYAAGRTVDLSFEGAAGVCMLPVRKGGVLRRVNGIAAAQKIVGVTGVSIAVREGYELTRWPEGCSYPGFVFARADSPRQVVDALTRAAEVIEFTVSPSFPVAISG